MKQFLLEKINNFTQVAVEEFQQEIVGPLPKFTIPSVYDESTTIWGQNEHGFWYTNKIQGYFFENNGTIHTAGVVLSPWYYQIYKDLHTNQNGYNVLTPVLTNREVSTSEHIDHIQYIQFQTPNRVYGKNLEFVRVTNLTEEIPLYLQDYIDQLGAVYLTLHRLGKGLLPVCNFFNFSIGVGQNYFMFFENFETVYNYQDGVNKMLITLNDRLDKHLFKNITDENRVRIIRYAKNQWMRPVLEDALSATLDNLGELVTNKNKNDIIGYAKELCLPSTI